MKLTLLKDLNEMADSSKDAKEEQWGVFMTGGSIGDKKDKKPMKVFDNKADAKAKAKSLKKGLSPGERDYYTIKFVVKQLNEQADDLIYVSIGHDDHCSLYGVTSPQLKSFLTINDADDMNDAIMKAGEDHASDDQHCDKGDIFFDLLNKDVDEFHSQIKEIEA